MPNMAKINLLIAKTFFLIALTIALTTPAFSLPVADGRFDPSEGYTAGYLLDFNVQGGGTVGGGQLWLTRDSTSSDVFVAFIQPRTLIDNTYGANAVGWGKNIAPSGKNHNFKDLVGSDKAQFQFKDAIGNVLLDVYLDYISKSEGAYRSLGATGGDGHVNIGSAGTIKGFGTSLDYNFNTLGHVFTMDSPATDSNYSDPLSAPGWIFDVIYEIQVDGSIFETADFGEVTIPIVHDSPNKIGKNRVYPEPDGPIHPVPEPGMVILLGCGLASLILVRKRS